jgi:hypothetical protein
VKAGQKLNVFQVKPTEADVGTTDGKTNFTVEPNETDLLVAACAAWATLTPKQRALTYAMIAQQSELWPAEVVLNKPLQLGGGATVREGEKLSVLEVHPDKLLVKSDALHGTFYVAPPATDVMAQARRFVEDSQAGPRYAVVQKQLLEGRRIAEEKRAAEEKQRAQVRVISELDGKLINSVTGRPEPFDAHATPRYIVFYRGSSTCPITRRFTPTLIRYYQQMKIRHPEFEIVWMMTEPPADTGKFARELGFSWRAVTYDDEAKLSSINNAISGKLPQLLVVDQSGRILANGSQESAPAALQQLDALLRTSVIQ